MADRRPIGIQGGSDGVCGAASQMLSGPCHPWVSRYERLELSRGNRTDGQASRASAGAGATARRKKTGSREEGTEETQR